MDSLALPKVVVGYLLKDFLAENSNFLESQLIAAQSYSEEKKKTYTDKMFCNHQFIIYTFQCCKY